MRMKSEVAKNNFKCLFLLAGLAILISLTGCNPLPSGSSDDSAIPSYTSKLNGQVLIEESSGGSVLADVRADKELKASLKADLVGFVAVPDALVWIEELPGVAPVRSDSEGKYEFKNIPPGEFHVVAQYKTIAGKVFKNRSQPVESKAKPEPAQAIKLLKAEKRVSGTLKDSSGKPLPQGTVLRIWGETFRVGENGKFTSPPLPEQVKEADLQVVSPGAYGSRGAHIVKVPFFSNDSPTSLDIELGESGATKPIGAQVEMLKAGQPVTVINTSDRVELVLKLENISENDTGINFDWTCSKGTLASDSRATAWWTAPESRGLATVSVKISAPNRGSYKVNLPVTVEVPIPSDTGVTSRLVFKQQTSNASAGSAIEPSIKVRFEDAYGNLVDSNDEVTISIHNDPSGGAKLSGTKTVAAVDGVAVFHFLSINKAGKGFVLRAASGDLAPIDSEEFDIIPGEKAKMVIATQPEGGQSGSLLATQPVIEIHDEYGNLVVSDNLTTVTVEETSGLNGTLSGETTKTAQNGIVTFDDLKLSGELDNDYVLSFSSNPQLPVVQAENVSLTQFSPVAETPTSLAFEQQPVTTTAGTAIAPAIKVRIEDANGNIVNANDEVTISIHNDPSGSAKLSGTKTVAAVNGVAVFHYLSIDKAANGFVLAANSGELNSGYSEGFNITPGENAKMIIATQPTGGPSGGLLATQPVIEIHDEYGNLVVTDSSTIVKASLPEGSGATLGGSTSVTVVNGIAQFSDLTLAGPSAASYKLNFISEPALPEVESDNFSLTPGAVAGMVIKTQPVAKINGALFETQPVIEIQDAQGNIAVSDNTTMVTVAITSGANGSLSGTTTRTAQNGIISFSDLKLIGQLGTDYVLSFTASTQLPVVQSEVVRLTQAGPIAQASTNITDTLFLPAGDVQKIEFSFVDAQGNRAEAEQFISVTTDNSLVGSFSFQPDMSNAVDSNLSYQMPVKTDSEGKVALYFRSYTNSSGSNNGKIRAVKDTLRTETAEIKMMAGPADPNSCRVRVYNSNETIFEPDTMVAYADNLKFYLSAADIYGNPFVGSYTLRIGPANGDAWYNQETIFSSQSMVESIRALRMIVNQGYAEFPITADQPGDYSVVQVALNGVVIHEFALTIKGFSGGSGTEADPWQIATAENLDTIRYLCGSQHADKHFLQIADIDLTEFLQEGNPGYNEGKLWKPLGHDSYPNKFYGNYNGNNKEIQNLRIVGDTSAEYQSSGLFGHTQQATITNVNLTGVDIGGQVYYAGGLIGSMRGGTVENCSVSGTISGGDRGCGGLIGYADDYSDTPVIKDCSTDVAVDGNLNVGGLIGKLYDITLSRCSSQGAVSGNENVGGLIGFSYATVKFSYSNSTVTGNELAGGFVGYNDDVIENSYATGAVVSAANGDYFGGFAGTNIGYISYCYSTGSVDTTLNSGGFVGTNPDVISDCYWDTETSGLNSSSGATGKTTAEMQLQDTYVNWDFTSIWSISAGSYPDLSKVTP